MFLIGRDKPRMEQQKARRGYCYTDTSSVSGSDSCWARFPKSELQAKPILLMLSIRNKELRIHNKVLEETEYHIWKLRIILDSCYGFSRYWLFDKRLKIYWDSQSVHNCTDRSKIHNRNRMSLLNDVVIGWCNVILS